MHYIKLPIPHAVVSQGFVNKKIELTSFVRPSANSKYLIQELEAHEGLFVIEDREYDGILYCGTDNLYFSYCFNCKTGRAVFETLLIIDSIEKLSDTDFLIKGNKTESIVHLKG